MRKSRLLVMATMLLLLFGCLLSVPALSGENPWDADDNGGGATEAPEDSTQYFGGTHSVTYPHLPSDNYQTTSVDWLTRLMIRMSFTVMNYIQGGTSEKAQTYEAYK